MQLLERGRRAVAIDDAGAGVESSVCLEDASANCERSLPHIGLPPISAARMTSSSSLELLVDAEVILHSSGSSSHTGWGSGQ